MCKTLADVCPLTEGQELSARYELFIVNRQCVTVYSLLTRCNMVLARETIADCRDISRDMKKFET